MSKSLSVRTFHTLLQNILSFNILRRILYKQHYYLFIKKMLVALFMFFHATIQGVMQFSILLIKAKNVYTRIYT